MHRNLVIGTTLLNVDEHAKDDLAQVYRAHLNEVLDLWSIKITMKMDLLRCKTPELFRKEIWMHVLAYNLIRTIMAQTASQEGIAARTISFKETLQVLEAFQPTLSQQAHRGVEHLKSLYLQMLRAIAQHGAADRPDRFEPRMMKRRLKKLRPPYEATARDQTSNDQTF
jgi:hypothetical protein